MNSHVLEQLLLPEEYRVVDARPRILAREALKPRDNLVDLEHARLRALMVEPDMPNTEDIPVDLENLSPRQRRRRGRTTVPKLGAYSWYSIPRANLTAVLSQQQPFREQTRREEELLLMPEEGGDGWCLKKVWKEKGKGKQLYLDIDSQLFHVDLGDECGERISCWGETDYMELLTKLSEELDISLERCAELFGVVTVPESMNGWRLHPALGFTAKR